MKSILIKVAVIVVSTALIQWLMNVCNNKITYNVSRDLRKKAFEKIEILPFHILILIQRAILSAELLQMLTNFQTVF